jgi:hypothetical protein
MNKEKFEMYAESLILNPFLKIINTDGKEVLLNSICENPKIVFLLISDKTCKSCIHYCLEDIYSFVPNIEPSNIDILGSYDNKRSFFQLSRKYPFQFFFLAESSILNDLEIKSQNPLFFTIEYPNNIKNAFSPISSHRILTTNYISTLLKVSDK